MIEIRRHIMNSQLTEGQIYVAESYICDSLELPWRNNKTDISCIPAAMTAYRVVKRPHGRFYEAYKKRWGHDGSLWIKPVNGRKVILMHTGTKLEHTLGCPLTGEKVESGRLINSRLCYERLWDALEPHWKDYEDVGIPLSVYCGQDPETEVDYAERLSMKPEEL